MKKLKLRDIQALVKACTATERQGSNSSPPTVLLCCGVKSTCDQPTALEGDQLEDVTRNCAQQCQEKCEKRLSIWVRKQALCRGSPELSLVGRWDRITETKGALKIPCWRELRTFPLRPSWVTLCEKQTRVAGKATLEPATQGPVPVVPLGSCVIGVSSWISLKLYKMGVIKVSPGTVAVSIKRINSLKYKWQGLPWCSSG